MYIQKCTKMCFLTHNVFVEIKPISIKLLLNNRLLLSVLYV